MKKIVGIIIMGLFLIGNCTMFTQAGGEYGPSGSGDPLNELSGAKADLQSQFNNCANQIDESILTGVCDITQIQSHVNTTIETLQGLVTKDKIKNIKNTHKTCINNIEKGSNDSKGLIALQNEYDKKNSTLNKVSAQYDARQGFADDEYTKEIKTLTAELGNLNTQINALKNKKAQCEQIFSDIEQLQNQINNLIGDLKQQQRHINNSLKKQSSSREQLAADIANSNGTKSSLKKQIKANNQVDATCLSARDFLYTLKYGTTMKKGNPGNDLIENRSPREMLDKVVYDANAIDQYQETAMDGVTSRDESCVNGGGRITNTLCWVKNHIHPYIQWIVYLGLTLSVILLIYNGFKMVTNVMHGEGDFGKIKTNILYIGLGIIILTGFYYLLDIVMAIINFLFD